MKWILLILCLILTVFLSNAVAEETIRLTNGEWPPFLSEDLKHGGVVSRIVKEAFAHEGVIVEYGYFPWKRAYDLALHGDWDGTVVWYYTQERSKHFFYGDSVFESKGVFFHLKDYPFDWNSLADLKGVSIGAVSGYSNGKNIDAAEKAGKLLLERVPVEQNNFQKLLAKRIELFTSDLDVGYSILNRHFKPEEIQRITHHPKPHYVQYMHLLLSKKNKRNKILLKRFNKGLKSLKASGEYDLYFKESRSGKYLK